MRRLVVLAVLLAVAAALAGCLGDDGGAGLDEASTPDPDQPEADDDPVQPVDAPANASETEDAAGTSDESGDAPNPWQAGLADHYPTPDVAKTRNASDRRANVAEPGHPEFAGFDAKIRAWMEAQNVSTGQLALMRDGQLRYERGYGYTDRAGTEPANASTMFRIASVTKPVAAALVSLQVEQGLYNWSDPVFCLGEDPAPNCRLPIDPHPARPVQDERLAEMKVEHLLSHRCGWGESHDYYTFGDGAVEAAREMGLSLPLSAWRTAQYLMGEPMAYAPGQERIYSNPCYILAGLVAEAATGAELGALYDAYLFRPLEIQDDIEPGYTRPQDRNPREPFYHCAEEDESVFDPNQTVCEPNGEMSLETNLANGGLVATAEAVAAVYHAYPDHVPDHRFRLDHGAERIQATGLDCPPSTVCRSHSGEFPGTTAMSGMILGDDWTGQFVYVFNKAVPGPACTETVRDALRSTPQPYYECTTDDVEHSLFHQTAAWARAEEATP